jgi:sortase (surface protein transpeptidase)
MATTWLSGRRSRVARRLAGDAALGLVLGATLVFAWTDKTPNLDTINTAPPPTQSAMSLFAPTLAGAKDTLGSATAASASIGEKLSVPTSAPVQLLIPSLDIHRPVEQVGTNRSGVMDLPANFWNAGWLKSGPVPGAPGDAVIEGHAGYPGQPLIFGRLVTLHPGDHIIVVLGDGTRRLFLVESMTRVPVGAAPPGMAEPYGPPRLTLITCTGHFDQGRYSYSQRLVLEASYAGLA